MILSFGQAARFVHKVYFLFIFWVTRTEYFTYLLIKKKINVNYKQIKHPLLKTVFSDHL